MAIHRRAAKRDTSEKPIFDYLRKAGWSVLPISVKDGPDAFIAKADHTIAIECKTGKKKLRPGQQRFADEWKGLYYVLRSLEEAQAFTRAIKPLEKLRWYSRL